MKSVFVYFLIFAICLFYVGCKDNSLANIESRGFLTIGIIPKIPPLAYWDSNGNLEGLEVLLARKLAKDLLGDESRLQMVTIEMHHQDQVLASSSVDMVLGSLIDGNQERLDFADPYMRASISIISHTKNISMQELLDTSLIVHKNTPIERYFLENYPHINLISYESLEECFLAFKANPNTNMATLNTIAFAWIHQNPQFSVSIPNLGNCYEIAPAVQKGNKSLLKWLNKEIQTLQKDGFFLQISETTLLPFYGKELNSQSLFNP